jgi:prepilin-type N-terminal cleavage/methylation domain-containing protein
MIDRRTAKGDALKTRKIYSFFSAFRSRPSDFGFTLVELMAAAAVIAVGMVFVLGAFNQCMSALTTAQRTITASRLLNAKIWEDDAFLKTVAGLEAGNESGVFSPPYENFNWSRSVYEDSFSDYGNESAVLEKNLNKEELKVIWQQGKKTKDISITRCVKKNKKV